MGMKFFTKFFPMRVSERAYGRERIERERESVREQRRVGEGATESERASGGPVLSLVTDIQAGRQRQRQRGRQRVRQRERERERLRERERERESARESERELLRA